MLFHTSNGSYTKSQLISHNISVIGIVLFICITVIPEAPAKKKKKKPYEKLDQETALKNLQFIKIRDRENRHKLSGWHTQVHCPGIWWRPDRVLIPYLWQWARKPNLESLWVAYLPNSWSCVLSWASILLDTLKFSLLHLCMSKTSITWQECWMVG